jgi:putative endonuclease
VPCSSTDPRRLTGRLGEELAAAHLQRLGFEILERNVRTRQGEIDLIACDGRTLVFAEVKTARGAPGRTSAEARWPDPLAGLGAAQRARLRRLATAWLTQSGRPRPRAADIRFDAIGVVIDAGGRLNRLDHLEGAW